MKFYVIYSYDVTKDRDITYYQPSNLDRWKQTENDDLYEFDYLGESFKDGQHRKYVAEDLTKEEFQEFIRETGLVYEDVETMGSLTDIGWLPALSFNGDNGMLYYETSGLIYQNAYVTPFPEPVRDSNGRFKRLLSDESPQVQGFWPMTTDEIEEAIVRRQRNDWQLLVSVFKSKY